MAGTRLRHRRFASCHRLIRLAFGDLDADPTAAIGYRTRTANVVARRVAGEQTAGAIATGATVFAGTARCPERVGGREHAVFILEQVG